MNNTIDILEKIRDHYSDIQLLTMHCYSDNDPETIPAMISQRSELLELIALEERRIAGHPGMDGTSFSADKLRAETASLISAISTLDKQLETVIRNRMRQLKTDLSMLYNTSHAASAYAVQSRS